MNKITYTFPDDCPARALRGVTVTGGVPIRHQGKDAVRFETRVGGQTVIALVDGKPELEAAVAAYRKAAADRAAAVAEAEYAKTPRGQREALVRAEYNTYSPDAFPGSAQWRANKAAADALAAFDTAHPELAAELAAERAAAQRARIDGLSEFALHGG